MDKREIRELLEQVARGETGVDEALLQLKMQPIAEIGDYAKVDLHRGLRQGVPEIIYGAGKTPEQILGSLWPRSCRCATIPGPKPGWWGPCRSLRARAWWW